MSCSFGTWHGCRPDGVVGCGNGDIPLFYSECPSGWVIMNADVFESYIFDKYNIDYKAVSNKKHSP